MSKKGRRLGWMLLAVVLLIFPLYALVAWKSSWKEGLPQAENMGRYLSHFPSFIQSKESIAWVALLLNIASNMLTIGAAVGKKTRGRWMSALLLIVGIPIMLWLAFTLL